MDAHSFLAQRLGSYQQSYYAPFMDRLKALKLTNDTPEPDPEEAVRGMDPAVIRGEFDGVVRAMSADFVAAFNEMLGLATAKEPLAARFADRYRMRPEYQLTFEQQLRSSLTPLWAAIAEIAPVRHAYLAYLSERTGGMIRAGLTATTAGAMAGSIFGPLGMVVGGGVGWLMGDQIDKRGEQLLADYDVRFQALLHAVDAGWEQLSSLLSSRFEATFGEALQRLSQDVAAEKRRVEEERRRIEEENRRRESERRRIEAAASETRRLEQRDDRPSQVVHAPRRELPTSEPHWTVKYQGAAWALVGGSLILGIAGVGAGGIWYATSRTTAVGSGAPPSSSHATALSGATPNVMTVPAGAALRSGPGDAFQTATVSTAAGAASVLDASVPGWTKVQLASGEVGWVSDSNGRAGAP